ncbi:MAG: ATP synthase subunit delta [Clostridia bacterium 41_269]|nr:MAG: ATP synthase subunit delta [Clostridia bacterium 41_269]
MSQRSLARRYAQALFMSAVEKNILDQVEEDLRLVVDEVEKNKDFKRFIDQQLIPPDEKIKVIEKIFEGKISDISMNFLKLVFRKRRERLLKEFLEEFVDLADSARGIEKVEITTAVELTSERREFVKNKISEIIGKKVKLVEKVDPKILGGIVVKIGDKVYDGSVLNKLNALKRHLKSVHLQIEEDRGEMAT